MTDRPILRFGLGASAPSYMRPGELAAGTDASLWIAKPDGSVQQVSTGGGGGGSYTLTSAGIATALGYTPYNAGANASGFLNSSQVVALVTWTNLSGKPSFATVATTGAYADLTGKPTLFDGAYASLSGKPTLFDGTYAALTGKPTLFDGTYAALTGKPTLGGAAALNVGTTAGTVAAGDDSRFAGGGGGGTATVPVTTVAASGTTRTISFPTNGDAAYDVTLNGNCVFTLTGGTAGQMQEVTLVLHQDATAGRVPTLPTGVQWGSPGAPTPNTAAGVTDIFRFVTFNGGTTVYGSVL